LRPIPDLIRIFVAIAIEANTGLEGQEATGKGIAAKLSRPAWPERDHGLRVLLWCGTN
jgi:hypothetical protein